MYSKTIFIIIERWISLDIHVLFRHLRVRSAFWPWKLSLLFKVPDVRMAESHAPKISAFIKLSAFSMNAVQNTGSPFDVYSKNNILFHHYLKTVTDFPCSLPAGILLSIWINSRSTDLSARCNHNSGCCFLNARLDLLLRTKLKNVPVLLTLCVLADFQRAVKCFPKFCRNMV